MILVEDLVAASAFPDGVEMVCDGMNCPYAMIRGHELNGTEPTMLPAYEEWQQSLTSTTSDSYESESTTWEDFIDCDATEFVAWQENAVALKDCVYFGDHDGSSIYVDHVCQDGSLTKEYYWDSECSGSTAHSEPFDDDDDMFCRQSMYHIHHSVLCVHSTELLSVTRVFSRLL